MFLVNAREVLVIVLIALLLFGGTAWAIYRRDKISGRKLTERKSADQLRSLRKQGVISEDEYRAAIQRLEKNDG